MKKLTLQLVGALLTLLSCQELDLREPGLLVPRTVDQDPSLPSIFVNGTQLHSEAFGNSNDPMIVVIHGGPGSDYRYILNCRAFADEGYYVVFYDQRGSGLSRREPKSSYTTQVMFDDLAGVIAHYRTSAGQKVILLGQSWGGILATAYIDQNPTAISGVILSEPGGFVWADIKDYVKRSRKYGITSESLSDVTFADQILTGRETEQEILDYKMGLANAAGVGKDNPSGIVDLVPFWRYGAIVNQALFEIADREQPDWSKNLGSFETKVLFFYSEKNTAYGEAHAIHVSSAYPNVQLERIDGTGHDMITNPNGFSQYFPLVLNYLNEIN